MIIVRVELHSANTGKITELARMKIYNDNTGTATRRNYMGLSYRGRSKKQLDKETIHKAGTVINWPSQQLHIWNLVRVMLSHLGYNQT